MTEISRDGLVAEYRFGGSADDTSGRGHHGAVHGATLTVDRFGNRDGAYAFDGKDDFIVVSPPPPLSDGALSVSVWVRYDTQRLEGWSNCIICQDDGNDADQSRRIFQLSTWWNRIVWHRMVRAPDPTAKAGVRYGSWCHVAAVYEGGVHSLYMDGVLHDAAMHPLSGHAHEPIHIGRKGTPEPCFFFRGAIDDVRLYNRALQVDEVRALFAEGGYQKPDQPE